MLQNPSSRFFPEGLVHNFSHRHLRRRLPRLLCLHRRPFCRRLCRRLRRLRRLRHLRHPRQRAALLAKKIVTKPARMEWGRRNARSAYNNYYYCY